MFNSVIQTAYKGAWAEYRRQLNVLLLRVKRDFREGKISKEKMSEMETKIFTELRVANRILSSSPLA
jgi:hypothetical protein